MSYDTGSWNMREDWRPPLPPEEGTSGWLDDLAFTFVVENKLLEGNRVIKLPRVKGYELGYFIVRSHGGGKDYFRVDNVSHYANLMEGQFDYEEK